METGQIVGVVAGYAVPVIAAPFVARWLKPLFTVFLREGAELIGGVVLPLGDAVGIARLLARLNVAILLLAWLGVFTCNCLGQSPTVMASVAIVGLMIALGVSILVARTNLEVDRQTSILVGMIAFAGGNLPLFVLGGALMALL